ncbi:hypothetical protein Esti_006356 [Eimeria stiedai]
MSQIHPPGIPKEPLAGGSEQALLRDALSDLGHPLVATYELGSLLSFVGLSALEHEEAKAAELLSILKTLTEAVAALSGFWTLKPPGERLAGLRLEGPVDHSFKPRTLAKDTVRGGFHSSSGSNSSSKNNSGSSKNSVACEKSHFSPSSTSTHVSEALLPGGVEGSASVLPRRRPRRRVFSENGIEISWLSPRRWESSPTVRDGEGLQRALPIVREQQQHAPASAATAANCAAAAAAAHFACLGDAAASGAATAACGGSEALLSLEVAGEEARAALAAREEAGHLSGFQLLRDLFSCLRDVFDAVQRQQKSKRWQQQRQRRQHKGTQLPSEPREAHRLSEASAMMQKANSIEFYSIDLPAYNENPIFPPAASAAAAAPAAAAPVAGAAAFEESAEFRSGGEPLPIPLNPWRVGGLVGRADAAAAAGAAAMSAAREAMMWRGHVAYRPEPHATNYKHASPQQQQQQQATATSLRPEPEKCLVLPTLAPVTEADIEKVLRRARLRGACKQ